MTNGSIPPARVKMFAALVAVIAAASGIYLYLVRAETPHASAGAPHLIESWQEQAFAAIRRRAHVAFRHMAPGPDYGRLSFASLDDRTTRLTTRLPCSRIHFTAKAGLCLTIASNPAGFLGYLIDDALEVTHTLDLPGMPSRTRVSPDGRVAAYTAFVAGDSYLASGLSTRTRIVDVGSGRVVGDLEAFTVTQDGRVAQSPDFNFWGVTFTRDGHRFYATVGSDGYTYLVEGDVAAKTIKVIAEDVECPALSPDETRIAFKKKFGSGFDAWWEPAVIDLATRKVRVLPEPRHMDDQIEWLDDGHILYAVGHSISAALRRADVWMLATDGSGAPTLFIADAESPAVVRPESGLQSRLHGETAGRR
ncbi:MAG TPA: hypothetical protein VI485_32650 [Vicinamibacterales bacterium]|nr:hypothetical protein [Vicinamibacterales bacterium]